MAQDQVTERPSGDWFSRFATSCSNILGSRWSFVVAIGVVLVWALTGPVFRYSDAWQLVINTGTTIITFLMVFLIQNTQNRDARAMNLKLDELICAIDNAKNQMVDIEHLSDQELDQIASHYERLRKTTADPRAKDSPAKEESPDISSGVQLK